MIQIFVALMLFVVAYAVSKFLLGKIPSIAELSEILSLVIGALAALIYIGAI